MRKVVSGLPDTRRDTRPVQYQRPVSIFLCKRLLLAYAPLHPRAAPTGPAIAGAPLRREAARLHRGLLRTDHGAVTVVTARSLEARSLLTDARRRSR